ncbi:MAG: phenylalanine--tRNA ligase beta subunit-related protein [Bacteroidales bacterium]|nr:phenylalanine--tRNA ligase beta subunit-related protein [Bacteroidales bacterium]
MITITIDNKLKEKWSSVAIGSVYAQITVKPSDPELIKLLDDCCNEFAVTHSVEDISQLKPIADSRKAYRALGKDPARYRVSSEALLRRIVKDKGIYKINNIVDINNLLSISSYYSICAFDVLKLNPPVRFTIGSLEDIYYGIGRGLLNIENLPVFEDQTGKFGSPTSDSERVKITNETNQLSMNIISFSGNADLGFQLEKLTTLLQQFAEAKNIEKLIIS